MRGAGESFGIATRFYLQTQPAPQQVIHFTYDLNQLYGSARRMAAAFVNAQSCLISRSSRIDRRLGLTVRLASGNYRIAGYYYGSYNSWNSVVHSCLGSMLPVSPTVEILSYAQALGTIAGRAPLAQPATLEAKSNFFAKSVLIPEHSPLSQSEMAAYLSTLVGSGQKVKDQWVVTFRLMGGVDGQVASKGDSFSAVSDRDSLWIVQHDGQTQRNPQDVTRFINQITDTLISATKGDQFGAFAPFVDPTLSNGEAHRKYFSPQTYSKLRDLKTIWDKNEVFKNPHSVWPRKSK